MKQVYKIDSNNFFNETIIINDNDRIPPDCVDVFPAYGLYKPKWVGGSWEEGLSREEIQAEIDAAKNVSVPMDETKKQLADLTFTLMMAGVI